MRLYQTHSTDKAAIYICCNFKMSLERIQSWIVFGKIRFLFELECKKITLKFKNTK